MSNELNTHSTPNIPPNPHGWYGNFCTLSPKTYNRKEKVKRNSQTSNELNRRHIKEE